MRLLKKRTWLGLFMFLLVYLPCLAETNDFGQFIYYNQVGYIDNLPKYIYTAGFSKPRNYMICDAKTNKVLQQGVVAVSTKIDPGTGSYIGTVDFSSFNIPGDYYIDILGFGRSGVFSVVPAARYYDALAVVQRGFFLWRCGMDLGTFAGKFTHLACHNTVANSPGEQSMKVSIGGWHDAGDFGRYSVNGSISVGNLLEAYELYPNNFAKDDLNIPESNNKIPDLVDEMFYQLDWLLSMQAPNGGVYHKVCTRQFSGDMLPNKDTAQLYFASVSSTATADFAAVMAKAARVLKTFDQKRSEAYLTAALKAAAFLDSRPDIVPTGGYKNDNDNIGMGEYGDLNDKDERFWAASELYRTTGEGKYHKDLEKYFATFEGFDAFGWQQVRDAGYITYLSAPSVQQNPALAEKMKNQIRAYLDKVLKEGTDKEGFGIHLTNLYDLGWGSNGAICNIAMDFIKYSSYVTKTEDEKAAYLAAAYHNLSYIFGLNIQGMSFVTGIGAKYPMKIHHRPSSGDGVPEPVPGMVCGGVNKYRQDGQIAILTLETTPPERMYIDDVSSYSVNEVAINWNAPLLAVLAYFTNQVSYPAVKPVIGKLKKIKTFASDIIITAPEAEISNVKLTWNKPKYKVKGYNIYRSGQNLGFTQDLSFVDREAIRGANYLYWVSAVNDKDLESNPSTPVVVKVPLRKKKA